MVRSALCGVVLALILGCGDSGPRRAEVSGTVTLNNQVITEGAIQFIPVEGTKGPSSGAAIVNGKYHIPRANGVTVGKNRVELRATRKTGRKVQDPTAKPGVLVEEVGEAFASEFNDKSTLVRDIQDGSQVLDFPIKK